MTHPRTQLRNEIRDLLQPLGWPVYAARARDLRKGEDEAVLIYTPSETLARAPGTGEQRPGLPVVRTISVEILILTRISGDGQEAADSADQIVRAVELALNNGAPDLIPVSAEQGFTGAEQMQCLTTLTYTIDHIDPMHSEA